jgi:hypothetical protein
MIDLGLGDAASTYRAWVDQVKRWGGTATTLPGSTAPAARYPMSVWAPKVNNREWPMPDAYSSNGQSGYYRASQVIVDAARHLKNATPAEAKAGAEVLMDRWSVPDPLRGLGNLVNSMKWAGGLLFAWWALDRYVTRGNRK